MKIRSIPPTYFLSGFTIIILLFLVFPEYNVIPFPYNLAGIVFIIFGIWLSGQARDLFKKYKTPISFDKSTKLVEDGIFSKTRNPMYLGMFIFLLGSAICAKNIFSLAIPFIFLIIIRILFIPYEEEKMHDTFGDDYLNYKKKVRRWF